MPISLNVSICFEVQHFQWSFLFDDYVENELRMREDIFNP